MAMNVFRLSGDGCHVFSIAVLLYRLFVAKNAQGVSLRTHELYLLTFCCRYLDLFMYYYSLYNSGLKLFYIGACIAVIYAMRCRIASTYDVSQDTFRHWIAAAAPCGVLALVTHVVGISQHGSFFEWRELLWTFSIYLEVMAIVPQLIVFQRYQNIDLSLRNYIFSLGAYRAFYILNWIYRANYERGYQHHWVVYFCGVLQTLFYADFGFFYYLRKSYPEMQMITYQYLSRFCHEPAAETLVVEESAQEAATAESYRLLSEEVEDIDRNMEINASTDGTADDTSEPAEPTHELLVV